MMQDRPASMLRYSTARKIPLRSPQNERRAARMSGPGFSVTTRKIAARVSGATIGCATARAALGALFGLESIVCPPGELRETDYITCPDLAVEDAVRTRAAARCLGGSGRSSPRGGWSCRDFRNRSRDAGRAAGGDRNPCWL